VSYCSDGLIASDTAIDLLKTARANFIGEKLRPIAAMLLDIQMPMKSGLRVVDEVRTFCEENSEKLHQPTFIFLSSYITADFKKKIEAQGAGYCFEKPIRRENLNQIIELITGMSEP